MSRVIKNAPLPKEEKNKKKTKDNIVTKIQTHN